MMFNFVFWACPHSQLNAKMTGPLIGCGCHGSRNGRSSWVEPTPQNCSRREKETYKMLLFNHLYETYAGHFLFIVSLHRDRDWNWKRINCRWKCAHKYVRRNVGKMDPSKCGRENKSTFFWRKKKKYAVIWFF